MKLNFDKAKEQYQHIEIPEELDQRVNLAMDKAASDNRVKERRIQRWRMGTIAATLAVAAFTTGVNSSDAFAQSMEKIPLVRELARLVTIQETHEDLEVLVVDAVIPAVEGIGNKALETRINEEIQEAMNERIEEARQRALEYKKAFVETGGDPEAFHDLKMDIGYNLMSVNENRLSFEIYAVETMASAYTEYTYYNIDLEHSKVLTIEDVLGEAYQNKVLEAVRSQVAERSENPDYVYFPEALDTLEIEADQPFYLNEKGHVVVVFKKYEISPGFMGKQVFVIQ